MIKKKNEANESLVKDWTQKGSIDTTDIWKLEDAFNFVKSDRNGICLEDKSASLKQ